MNGTFHIDLEDILPGLIWMVILIVWFVGKIFNAAAAGRRKPPPPRDEAEAEPTQAPAAEELREFLETLTGRTRAPPRPSAPAAVPRKPPPLAQPRPAAREEPNVFSPYALRPPPEMASAVDGLPPPPQGSVRPTQVPGTESLLVGLTNLRLPGAALPRAHQWTTVQRHVSADIQGRASLRRAMVQRLVLGPPVALGGTASSPDLPNF
jgi:hypothetical protein